MLVPIPEDRLGVKEVLDRLARIVLLDQHQDGQGVSKDYYYQGKPWKHRYTAHHPPTWSRHAQPPAFGQAWNAPFHETSGPTPTDSFLGIGVATSLERSGKDSLVHESYFRRCMNSSGGTGPPDHLPMTRLSGRRASNAIDSTSQPKLALPYVSSQRQEHILASPVKSGNFHPDTNVNGSVMTPDETRRGFLDAAAHQSSVLGLTIDDTACEADRRTADDDVIQDAVELEQTQRVICPAGPDNGATRNAPAIVVMFPNVSPDHDLVRQVEGDPQTGQTLKKASIMGSISDKVTFCRLRSRPPHCSDSSRIERLTGRDDVTRGVRTSDSAHGHLSLPTICLLSRERIGSTWRRWRRRTDR